MHSHKLTLIISFIVVLCLHINSVLSTCICVPFYQCSDDENSIISDGRGLLDVRRTKQCDGVFEVCCNSTVSSTTAESVTKPPRGCGYQNEETFQWSASLLYKQFPYIVPSYKCRVSLIHPMVAITAAHCLEDKGFYLVKISNTTRPVAQMFSHPLFNEASLQNDIAVLLLSKPFKTEKTGLVCLPPPGIVLESLNCTTATRVEQENENLKVISSPVLTKDDCVATLRKTRLGKFFQLHQSFLCAGGDENRYTCGGDGGSPLICPVPGLPGRFQQVGIVSWGIGCGQKVPGVYTNLVQLREWIDKVMLENKLDINTYRL